MTRASSTVLSFLFIVLAAAPGAVANPNNRKFELPKTNFTKHSVDLGEILSGGLTKDGNPVIDNLTVASLEEAARVADNDRSSA